MVKGVTRQVILVDPPDRQHFEKAIFILKDGGAAFTEEALLDEARALAEKSVQPERGGGERLLRILYALAGAGLVGAAWLLSGLLA